MVSIVNERLWNRKTRRRPQTPTTKFASWESLFSNAGRLKNEWPEGTEKAELKTTGSKTKKWKGKGKKGKIDQDIGLCFLLRYN